MSNPPLWFNFLVTRTRASRRGLQKLSASCVVTALYISMSVAAEEIFQVGSITIVNPFSYETASTSTSSEIYLILNNSGENMDRLIGIETPIAMSAQVFSNQGDDGQMKVMQLKLTPKKEIVLAPGRRYIKLTDLEAPLQEGESFPLTMVFEKAGSLSVNVTIRKANTYDDETEKLGASSEDISDYSVVYVPVKSGKVNKHQQSISFTQNDRVLIRFVSDQRHELHIHGYNIVVDVEPMSHTSVYFDATATGRFPVEIHGSNDHHALFYIEVYPD